MARRLRRATRTANQEHGIKTYRAGERFPGRIGRTYAESEPAFPVPANSPSGAPNVLYIVIEHIGFGAIEPFGGLIETLKANAG